MESGPIMRRSLIGNFVTPLSSSPIVAVDIIADGEQKQPRGVNLISSARRRIKPEQQFSTYGRL